MPNPNFSYHIFLLPFNWGKKDTKNIGSHFSDLVSLKKADELISSDTRWQHNLYTKFSQPEDYNEYVYFYPTVRDVLYDNDENDDGSRVIRHYQFLPAASQGLKYIIHVKTFERDKIYELEIDYILLNLYKTGIGLLSYHLKNTKADQQDWKDILAINDFGRRIYPPYFDYSGQKRFSASVPKGTSLANSIRISGSDNKKFIDIVEDFEIETGLSVNFKSTKPSQLQQIPNHIRQVLPTDFCNDFNVSPTLDDRMFVVSSVCDNEAKHDIIIKSINNEPKHHVITRSLLNTNALNHNSEFYRYIFIDGPGSLGVANKDLEQELLKTHLYTRWKDFNTLYGVSRYSLVSYTTWDKILVDTRTMYYKIAELCLLQRSSVVKFSEEVRRIAAMNENESRYSAYINDLYKNYIIFINKIYFRDITPQEQGIELYDMLRDKMRIEKEVNDLDREINELHEYSLLQEERSANARLQLLTVLGGLFVVPSFIISYFGMNDPKPNSRPFMVTLFGMALVGLIASLVAVKQGKKTSRQKYFIKHFYYNMDHHSDSGWFDNAGIDFISGCNY